MLCEINVETYEKNICKVAAKSEWLPNSGSFNNNFPQGRELVKILESLPNYRSFDEYFPERKDLPKIRVI